MTIQKRTIIKIDEEACNGCGLCVQTCHEGAIDLVEGKAKLMRENFCDGLGDCLPTCPTGAITFEEREAPAYNEAAVIAAQMANAKAHTGDLPHGCPGSMAKTFERSGESKAAEAVPASDGRNGAADEQGKASDAQSAAPASGQIGQDFESELRQWPVQIKLVSPQAGYFAGADVLIAADCSAFAYGAFHRDFMAGKITLVGCPKLDAVDYAEKLSQIVAENDIASITVARMEVPCCGGIEQAAKRAVAASGKNIPVKIVTISTDGRIV